jgi:hypothetical protein
MRVTTLGLAAFSRADSPPAERRPFFVYVDEFQSFTTLALANMLSELRKYRVGFTFAHQYLHQLEPDVRHAVVGNAGAIISLRVGAEDVPFLTREFQPRFDELDLLQLPNYSIYLKLMIDGTPSLPFSAVTLGPGTPGDDAPAVTATVMLLPGVYSGLCRARFPEGPACRRSVSLRSTARPPGSAMRTITCAWSGRVVAGCFSIATARRHLRDQSV